MTFTLRCRRCNGPHYQHADANKHGGTGRLLHWDGDLCPVCQNKHHYQDQAALWRLMEYRRRDPSQESLTNYE